MNNYLELLTAAKLFFLVAGSGGLLVAAAEAKNEQLSAIFRTALVVGFVFVLALPDSLAH